MTWQAGRGAARLGVDRMGAAMLSRRENECVSLVADGKTDGEIGLILNISERTSRFHIDNARRKFGVATRIQLIVRLIREGVLQ